MRSVLLVILFGLVLLCPQPVQAQGNVRLDTVQISLWPEYDRAEMLVIFRVWLPEDIELPQQVSLPIPAASGEPNAVAEQSSDGELVYVDYQREEVGDWAYIEVTANNTYLHMEYYDPGLLISDGQREYTMEWTAPYPVTELLVDVQQPFDAHDMQILPSVGTGLSGTDGLVYYQGSLGELDAGDEILIDVRYQKDSDALTASHLQATTTTADESGGLAVGDWLPWALAVVGVLLIGYGGYRYWRAGQLAHSPRPRRQSQPSAGAAGGFCHQCGTPAAKGDRFCRNCGTRLRT
jgi:hypothetical protein